MLRTVSERLDAFLQEAGDWPDAAVREIASSLHHPATAIRLGSVSVDVVETLIMGIYAIGLVLLNEVEDPPDTESMLAEAQGLINGLRALACS